MKTIEELWKKLEKVELIQVRPSEMELLCNHLHEFEHPLVLEIGVAHGASTILLEEKRLEIGGGGGHYCIDNFIEDYYSQEKFGDYARKSFLKNVKNYNLHIYDMSSKEATSKIIHELPKLIDLLFIDGDHSYEGVKSDCEDYLPLLNSGGYVGFHDYNNVAFGVKKAVDEFCGGWQKESEWDLAVFKKP